MSNIVTKDFNLTPASLDEAIKFANLIAKSQMIPKSYHGKPEDILLAVQMGAELGLKPFQSLQNIACINGKPSIYGDALLALVRNHPEFEYIQEYVENDMTAVCKIKRKNQPEHTVIFTVEDAKRAGLWNKVGPWSQYPKRMLMWRARGWNLRDTFADCLFGLITREEASDYQSKDDMTEYERSMEIRNTIPVNEITQINEISKTDEILESHYLLDKIDLSESNVLAYLTDIIEAISTKEKLDDFLEFKKRNAKVLGKFIKAVPEAQGYLSEISKRKQEEIEMLIKNDKGFIDDEISATDLLEANL